MNPSKLLILFIVTLCISDCTSSDNPTETDISVTTIKTFISWADEADLEQKLDQALVYNYCSAQESEVQKQLLFNADTTLAVARVSFKDEFKNDYQDTDFSNNEAQIELEKDLKLSASILKADGPGDTYDLITSVLAPGANPIETPDCNHTEFGDHIDETFDNELNMNVFQFYIHVEPDNDRCINFDRQRNEIKTYSASPDYLLGIEDETVVYKWKFKLPSGFQSSQNFTHIHQLKSVGGPFDSMPMYTLTTRKSNPDRLELRYAEIDKQITLSETPLAPFLDEWVEVTETILYGRSGTYDLEINRISDGEVLFNYSSASIINWRESGDFVRPKWGIYRSLINAHDLRDETVLFADFSIEEL